MDVAAFSEVAETFELLASTVVWATTATIDRQGRPRSRIVHPVWDGPVGYVGTRAGSFKTKHLALNPFVSLSYFHAERGVAYADCRAEWIEDLDARLRAWETFKAPAAPYGYDPATIWPAPDHSSFALLELRPWRLEVASLEEMQRAERRVWRGQ